MTASNSDELSGVAAARLADTRDKVVVLIERVKQLRGDVDRLEVELDRIRLNPDVDAIAIMKRVEREHGQLWDWYVRSAATAEKAEALTSRLDAEEKRTADWRNFQRGAMAAIAFGLTVLGVISGYLLLLHH